MIYFDTSYILKCYINEVGSREVRRLACRHDRIACCEYGRMELSAAIHRALRERLITTEYLETVLEQFRQDEEDRVWTWLPLNHEIIDGVIDSYKTLPAEVYLRTGDAIHLKCAARNSITSFYTNDAHLLRAAHYFDVKALNVIVLDKSEQEHPEQ